MYIYIYTCTQRKMTKSKVPGTRWWPCCGDSFASFRYQARLSWEPGNSPGKPRGHELHNSLRCLGSLFSSWEVKCIGCHILGISWWIWGHGYRMLSGMTLVNQLHFFRHLIHFSAQAEATFRGFKMELEAKFAEHLSAVWNVCTTSVFPLLPIAAASWIGWNVGSKWSKDSWLIPFH